MSDTSDAKAGSLGTSNTDKGVTEITATYSAIIFLKRSEGVLDNYVLRKNHGGEEKASPSD